MTAIPSAAPTSPVPATMSAAVSRPALWRRVGLIVITVVALLITGLVCAALLGAWRDDRAIDGSTGRATAVVLSADGGKAIVRYTDMTGQVNTPNQGVAYPSGLHKGQLVQVEYAIDDPEQVRVAGRDWTVGLDESVVTLVVVWGIAVPGMWWFRRSAPRSGTAES